jgi:two-component system, LuxR family, response regulator FixJ
MRGKPPTKCEREYIRKESPIPQTHIPSDEIFIVDDDPLISDLLCMVLRSEGFRVTSFGEGETFYKVARQRAPTCIILDVFMPGRSGLELLKDIDARNYPAPVIIMSGMASISIAVEAVKNGASDIIEKPFPLDGIVTRVREVIDAWMLRRTATNISEIPSMEFPDTNG